MMNGLLRESSRLLGRSRCSPSKHERVSLSPRCTDQAQLQRTLIVKMELALRDLGEGTYLFSATTSNFVEHIRLRKDRLILTAGRVGG